jgi:hypothetical protein
VSLVIVYFSVILSMLWLSSELKRKLSVIDASLNYVTTSRIPIPSTKRKCWVLKKKDKQGPSLAPQVKSRMLGRSSKEDT